MEDQGLTRLGSDRTRLSSFGYSVPIWATRVRISFQGPLLREIDPMSVGHGDWVATSMQGSAGTFPISWFREYFGLNGSFLARMVPPAPQGMPRLSMIVSKQSIVNVSRSL